MSAKRKELGKNSEFQMGFEPTTFRIHRVLSSSVGRASDYNTEGCGFKSHLKLFRIRIYFIIYIHIHLITLTYSVYIDLRTNDRTLKTCYVGLTGTP